jgi:hypothetical protein
MIRWLVICAALSAPVGAETARVISGEHAEFTRLVVELAEATDWTVGRTAMGYGFATTATVQPGYDLSRVWDRIPRSRLQALRVDPDSGALLLTLACDCHVFPFEYQPGMVVLDIRNGAAPAGSVFEATLSTATVPPLRGQPPLARMVKPYDWLDQARVPPPAAPMEGFRFPIAQGTAALDPLRNELLLQLSRGAADGVIDMALPGKPEVPEVQGMGDLSGALIRIGTLPGLEVGLGPADTDQVPNEGCLPDDAIALPGWGDGRKPLDLLVEARAGLYEEFDTLSPDALRRAIMLHLYLGFGAEALQYGALLPGSDSDPDLAPLLSMARLIDGESDPTSPFLPMLGCDGSAALWATLAHSVLSAGTKVNTDAVIRSFHALPPHLRAHLGPRLATLLLEIDADAARMIRDAIKRTPDVPAGTVDLIDAAAELQAARPEEALGHAETAVLEDGSGLAGLVVLVEAHFQSGLPLSPEIAGSLQALPEVAQEDTERHSRALLLALALSGQVEAAFAFAGPDHPDTADLWRVVARQAEDDPFLAHAVLQPANPAPSVDPDVALAISVRLSDLGFPEAALVWLGPVGAADPPERRLAAARAELALGNARRTLQLLSGLAGPEDLALQAAAHQQLGAYGAAGLALERAGQADDSTRLAAWDSNWDLLQAKGSPAWADAAALVDPVLAEDAGPLAQGQSALDDSAAARLAIRTLLAEVPPPPP